MASQTIIDRLVVEFGLDPKKFTQGQKQVVDGLKEIEGRAKRTGDTVDKSAKQGDSSLAALGKRALTVAAIFKVLSYTTKNILEQSRAVYDLANAGRVLGESARNLKNFENVAEIMGGTAEGARKSIQGLKQAVFDLTFNGQMSQQLVQLGRLGVQFQDSRGRARDFKDIYLDTATALQRQVQSGQMSESDALMFAESAGFDPGLARAMVGGRDAASLALAKQENRRQINGTDIAEATRAEQAITSAGQAKDTAFQAAGSAGAWGAAARVATGLEGAWTGGATGDMSVVWEGWKTAIEPVTTGLGDLADATKAATEALWESARRAAGNSRGIRNNNPGNIRALPGQKADAQGFRIFDSMGEGVAAMDRQLDRYAGRGKNTVASIISTWAPPNENDTQAYINSVAEQMGVDPNATLTDADRAGLIAAMATHETGVRFDDANVADVLSLQQQAVGRDFGGGSSGGDMNVQIDSITVNTAATDAGGIANDISGAMKRKLTAAQADGGQN